MVEPDASGTEDFSQKMKEKVLSERPLSWLTASSSHEFSGSNEYELKEKAKLCFTRDREICKGDPTGKFKLRFKQYLEAALFHEPIRARLSERFNEDFMQQTTLVDKVRFVLNDEVHTRILDHLMDTFEEERKRRKAKAKNSETARRFTDEGLSYCMRFYCHNYALGCYNKAVVLSPKNEVWKVYFKRSNLFLQTEQYEKALLDVRHAINLGLKKRHPVNATDLLLHELKCLMATGPQSAIDDQVIKTRKWIKYRFKEHSDTFKVLTKDVDRMVESQSSIAWRPLESMDLVMPEFREPSSSNEFLQGTNAKIHVVSSEKMGRELAALVPIPKGELLTVETPICWAILPDLANSYCHYCMRAFDGRVIHCPTCSIVRYCTEDCRRIAMERFHKFECQFVENFQYAYTMVMPLKMGLMFGLDKIVSVEPKEEVTMENVVNVNAAKYDHTLDTVLTLLCKNETNFSDIHAMVCFSVFLAKISWHFLATDTSPDLMYRLATFYLKCHLQTELNAKDVYDYKLSCNPQYPGVFVNKRWLNLKPIGCAIYPVSSLASHACFANTGQIHVGHSFSLYAIRDIKRGEAITYDYRGVTYEPGLWFERQEELNKRFGFQCKCLDCVEGMEYPRSPCNKRNCHGWIFHKTSELRCCSDCHRKSNRVLSEYKKGQRIYDAAIEFFQKYPQPWFDQRHTKAADKIVESLMECLNDGVLCKYLPEYDKKFRTVLSWLYKFYEKTRDFGSAIKIQMKLKRYEETYENSLKVVSPFSLISNYLEIAWLYSRATKKVEEELKSYEKTAKENPYLATMDDGLKMAIPAAKDAFQWAVKEEAGFWSQFSDFMNGLANLEVKMMTQSDIDCMKLLENLVGERIHFAGIHEADGCMAAIEILRNSFHLPPNVDEAEEVSESLDACEMVDD